MLVVTCREENKNMKPIVCMYVRTRTRRNIVSDVLWEVGGFQFPREKADY